MKVMITMAEKQDMKHLVRIMKTDIFGEKTVATGLTRIKGVGKNFANAVCKVAGISNDFKVGRLDEKQVEKINSIISNPLRYDFPIWLLNRRKDYETGADLHLCKSDLDFTKDNDLKRLKMTKSYKGFRHHLGLPLRGQRTKSNFRRNKRKGALGVKRKK